MKNLDDLLMLGRRSSLQYLSARRKIRAAAGKGLGKGFRQYYEKN